MDLYYNRRWMMRDMLFYIVDPCLVGRRVDDGGIHMRDDLRDADVKQQAHQLFKVLQANAAGRLQDEVFLRTCLCDRKQFLAALQAVDRKQLERISAHLLHHGDRGLYRDDGIRRVLAERSRGDLDRPGVPLGDTSALMCAFGSMTQARCTRRRKTPD